MSFLTNLAPLLSALAANPTVAKYGEYLSEAFAAVLFNQATLRLGDYTIAITKEAAPSHLTIALAVFAIEHVLSGQEGDFQVGAVKVAIVRSSTLASKAAISAPPTPPSSASQAV